MSDEIDKVLAPPKETISPSPTFHPTPTPIPYTSKPTKSSQPTVTASSPPSRAPVQADQPKFFYENEQISKVTCENSFVNLDSYYPSYTNIESPITNLLTRYDYEIYINNIADREKALEEIETKIFESILATSPWFSEELESTHLCHEMLMGAMPQGRRLNEALNTFIGWSKNPMDTFSSEPCTSSEIINGYTCFAVKGRLTTQIPSTLTDDKFQHQDKLLNAVKGIMDDEAFITGKVNQVNFIGRSLILSQAPSMASSIPSIAPSSAPVLNIDPEEKTALSFGLLAGIFALIVAGIAFFMWKREQNAEKSSPLAQMESLQRDVSVICDSANEEVIELSPSGKKKEIDEEGEI
ncbi:predicted protein [Chaetoceros tenuissimus]|uniref:Uncharacterized protein n=1 Tax=Chaetoceros tenuissimus TaxID=426638 RepID=A0AAD3D0R8_9STRA|nr:predicted protein [Chaetoceros tenuissimus]